MIKVYTKTPKVVALFSTIVILGAFFPIYGFSLGGFKLTLFRVGVFPLLITQYGGLFAKNKRLVCLIIVFFILRMLSVLWTEDISNGIKQVIWFFEGTCLLLSVNSASNRYVDYCSLFTKLVFVIGAVSIGYMLLQALLYFGMGTKLYVPFSQNIPEIGQNDYMWNYPIYGSGRIIGSFYEPNMAGSMCCYFFAFLFPFLIYRGRVSSKLIVLMLIFVVIAAIFTGSRQSIVSMVLCILFFFIYFSKNKAKVILTFFFISCLLYLIYLKYANTLGILFEDSENVFSRIDNARSGDVDDISGGRFSYIERVWAEYGVSHLLFGAGEGSTHGGGHNAFLAVFLENGIFTFFIYIAMIIKFWLTSWNSYRRKHHSINISACLIVISWVFLMFVNWAQLNQSLSFVYLCFVFLVSSRYMSSPAHLKSEKVF